MYLSTDFQERNMLFVKGKQHARNMEYQIGTVVLDDWKIVELIGEGAYGKVFKIEKTNYGITTYSALKVIRVPQSPADIRTALSEGMDEKTVTSYFQGFVDEIVKEIAIMATVKSHPNIVSYEDHKVFEDAGGIGWDILIRMELLTPFLDYIINHPLEEKEVLRLGIELSSALAFCQKKGLIHRDIKPENIFINETGQFKLGDFGVSKTVEKTTGGLSKKGTESYMAPEVYLGKPYGASVDIYSLGLVLYRLMNANRLPFLPQAPQPITFADRENALIQRMRGASIIPPSKAGESFGRVILKACEYLPEDRYRTAAEFHEALLGVQDQQSFKMKDTVGMFDGAFGTEESKRTTGLFGSSFSTEETERTTGLFGNSFGSEETEHTTGVFESNFGSEEIERTTGIFGNGFVSEETEQADKLFEKRESAAPIIDLRGFWKERLAAIGTKSYPKVFWGKDIPDKFISAILRKTKYGYLQGTPIGAASTLLIGQGSGILVTDQEVVISTADQILGKNKYGRLGIKYADIKDLKLVQGEYGENKLKILTKSNEIKLLSPDSNGWAAEFFDFKLLAESLKTIANIN